MEEEEEDMLDHMGEEEEVVGDGNDQNIGNDNPFFPKVGRDISFSPDAK